MTTLFFGLLGKRRPQSSQQTSQGQSPQHAHHGQHGRHDQHAHHGQHGRHDQHGHPGAHGGSPLSPAPQDEVFFLNNGIRLEVKTGDVTALAAGAVVAGENNHFTGGGAIAKALLRKGGKSYADARQKMIHDYCDGPRNVTVLPCFGGDQLQFTFVFHVLLAFHTDSSVIIFNNFEQLVDVYGHVLDLARRLRLNSIVTPLLGSGASGGKLDDCLKAAFVAFSNLKDNLIEVITIVEYDQDKAEVIRTTLKDRIEHLALTSHERRAPPRPSHPRAPDRTHGQQAHDERTLDPHRDRRRERGSPKRFPAPLSPSSGSAQRVSSGPPPDVSHFRPPSSEAGSPPVPPPRTKGKSDARSTGGKASGPGKNHGYKESPAADRKDKDEDAGRRSGDAPGEMATFDRKTKPVRGKEIARQRTEDLLNASENARPAGRKTSSKDADVPMEEISGGLNSLNIQDKPGIAQRSQQFQQNNFGEMERQGDGSKLDTTEKNRGVEIPINRVGMEEHNATEVSQPSHLRTRTSGERLPPQPNMDFNRAEANPANMAAASGGYMSHPTPAPQSGSTAITGESRGDNSSHILLLVYPHPDTSAGSGLGHDTPLPPIVYPHPDRNPAPGMHGHQTAGSQRYAATATAALVPSRDGGAAGSPVFPEDMVLPQVYPPPTPHYSAEARFSVDHSTGGPSPSQSTPPLSPRSPGSRGGSGYFAGAGLGTPPTDRIRPLPLGHDGNVGSTGSVEDGNTGRSLAELTPAQPSQQTREAGAAYTTGGTPRTNQTEQVIFLPPSSYGESTRVESSGEGNPVPTSSWRTPLQSQSGAPSLGSSLKQAPQEQQGRRSAPLQANPEPPPDYEVEEEKLWKEPKVHIPTPADAAGGGESIPAEKLQRQTLMSGGTRGGAGGSFTASPDVAGVQLGVARQTSVGAPATSSGQHSSIGSDVSGPGPESPLPPDSLEDYSFARDLRPLAGHVTGLTLHGPSAELHIQALECGLDPSQRERAGAEAARRGVGDGGEMMTSGHAPGGQPEWDEPKSADYWWDRPDWCYVNEEGNSTPYLGPNRGLLDYNNPDGSQGHFYPPEDYSSSIEVLSMPSTLSGFSSFAYPSRGSMDPGPPPREPGHPEDELKQLPGNETATEESSLAPLVSLSAAAAAAALPPAAAAVPPASPAARVPPPAAAVPPASPAAAPAAAGHRELQGLFASVGGDNREDAPQGRPTLSVEERSAESSPSALGHPAGHNDDSKDDTPDDSFFDVGAASDVEGDVSNGAERAAGNPDTPQPEILDDQSDGDAGSDDTSSSMVIVNHGEEGEEGEEEEGKEGEKEEPEEEGTRRSNMEGESAPRLEAEEGRGGQEKQEEKQEELQVTPTETMPDGKMIWSTKPNIHLDGFGPDCGTIVIEYSFSNGVQGPHHPAPGQPYKGTFRRAYLPDNQEGRRVLDLLQKAFDRKLTFQLVKPGPDQEWGMEFTSIPLKTSLRGGITGNGYPDPEYLSILRQVLRAHDIE